MCGKSWCILAALAFTASAQSLRTGPFTINTDAPREAVVSATGDSQLQIVSGQGQVLAEYRRTEDQNDRGGEPLTVRLVDSSERPMMNVPIEWTIEGSGNVRPIGTSRTDSRGFARAHVTASATGGMPYLVNRIHAKAPSVSQEATFYMVVLPTQGGLGTGSITVIRSSDPAIEARAGQVIPNAIQYTVVATDNGMPLPYIGMHIEYDEDPLNPRPTGQCSGGFAFSDERGIINCDLVVGPVTGGPRTLEVVVGAVARFEVSLEVVGGLPGRVTVVAGNNQSGSAGQQLAPLRVRVTDSQGRILPNTVLQWEIPQGVAVVEKQDVTNENGEASATLRLGQTPGPLVVRVRAGSAGAMFNLTATAGAGALTRVSGDSQNAALGQQFPQPLVVRAVDAQGDAVPNVIVNFAVAGPATLSAATATTAANGEATVRATAGNTAGSATVTASLGALSTTFALTVRPAGPVFTASDVLDGAGYQPGVSPGSIVYIRVRGIAPALQGSVMPQNPNEPLPTKLADVEVLFNDTPAPIYAVSNVNGEESVSVQVPFETNAGTASVTVRTATGSPATVNDVSVLPAKPGVFMFRDVSERIYAVATRPDGSYVTSANPARRGETILIYATGLGQTTPPTATNRVSQADQAVSAELVAGINNQPVRVVSAKLLPGAIGVYEIAVEIPQDTPAGPDQPVTLAVRGVDGSLVSANNTALPVQ